MRLSAPAPITDALRARRPDLWYSLLYAPPDARTALIAVYALCAELLRIARYPGITEIAAVRLAWWGEELAQPPDRAQHPLTRALYEAAPWLAADPALRRFLEALRKEQNATPYATPADLAAACCTAWQPVVALTARILGVGIDAAFLDDLAIGLDLTQRLPDLGRGLLRPEPAGLDDRVTGALAAQAAWHLAQATGPLPRVLATQVRFARALLTEWRRSPARPLGTRITLTPMRMIWIATFMRGS